MSDVAKTYEREGDAIVDGTPTLSTKRTIVDYLLGCVNMDIPEEAIVRICIDREVDINEDIELLEKKEKDLCKADLYVWMCLGVSKRGTVSDSDNGWSHSDGGYTLSADDKKLLLKAANSIYEEYGEKTIGTTKFKVRSHGISPCNLTIDKRPLPHILC